MGDEPKDLLQMLRTLTALFTSLNLRVYAIQTLLTQSGAFSSEDVDARIEEIRPLWDSAIVRLLEDPIEEERAKELGRVLESYEGPKQ